MPLPDPVPALKRQLAAEIRALIATYHQAFAASILGLDQPRASDLTHGRLERFSLQKLIRILARVDRPVVITVVHDGMPPVRFRIPRREPRPCRRRPGGAP
jgi:predicted XRE-type DNA-binding protein